MHSVNLRNDVAEKNDLAAKMSDKVKDLAAQLAAWRTDVGGDMPTRNAGYGPAKPSDWLAPAAQPGGKAGKGKKQ